MSLQRGRNVLSTLTENLTGYVKPSFASNDEHSRIAFLCPKIPVLYQYCIIIMYKTAINLSPHPCVTRKCKKAQSHVIFVYSRNMRIQMVELYLGAVYMSRASPANRADLSHENR